MTRRTEPLDRLLLATCIAAALALAAPLAAQEQPPPAETSADTTTDPPAAADLLEPNEIDALVAPVVLYPDPLLSLVLQASITPLDMVEAERFLARREKDPALTPDPDWDPSVVGLLNYPQLVGSMSEYLDWTQLLGTAVVEQIDAVQASIQVLRLAAVDRGILVSNEVQKVVETDGVVMIAPASKDQMSVPQYDPVELLAALTPAESGSTPEEAAGGTTVIVNVEQPPPAAEALPAEALPAEAPVAETPPDVAPLPAESAPAPVAEAAPAAAPASTYYAEPAPTYVAPPPPVSYAEPQSTFWSTAATFAGGAVMGGLLGYAWGEDDANDDGWDDVEDAIRDLDDDDWDNFVDQIDEDDFDQAVDRLNDRDWDEVRAGAGRDVNISDSTIVVGNDLKRNQLDAKLKNKRDAKVNLAGGQRTQVDMRNGVLKREGDTRVAAVGNRRVERPRGPAPAAATRERGQNRQVAANRPARDVKLPGAKGANGANVGSTGGGRQAVARPTQGQPRQAQGAQRRQAQATRRPGSEPQAASRAVASGIDRPREAQRASQRGAASKAKAGVKRPPRPEASAQRGGAGQRAAAAAARPQRQRVAAAERGVDRPMGGIKSGQSTRRDASRGQQSLAKAGGGRRGGGGGGRRG